MCIFVGGDLCLWKYLTFLTSGLGWGTQVMVMAYFQRPPQRHIYSLQIEAFEKPILKQEGRRRPLLVHRGV